MTKLNFTTKTKSAETLSTLKVCVSAFRNGTFKPDAVEIVTAAVEDYIRLKSTAGRPLIYQTDAERAAARRKTYAKANAKRAAKAKSEKQR